MFKKDTCLNLITLLFCFIFMNGCKTTEILSDIDKGLGKVANTLASEDKVTGRMGLNFTNDNQKFKSGLNTMNRIIKSETSKGFKILSKGNTKYDRAKIIYDRILIVSHYGLNTSLKFVVIDKKIFNAFATGGGHIALYTGLIDELNDDELALVIAHELAHNSLSHVSEQSTLRLIDLVSQQNLDRSYYTVFTNVNEQEADRIGILYSALAGFDPYAGYNLWKKKASLNPRQFAYYRSHPLGYERSLQNLKTAKLVEKYYIKGIINPSYSYYRECNSLYCKKNTNKLTDGSGGGLLKVLEIIADVTKKASEVMIEYNKQKYQQQMYNNYYQPKISNTVNVRLPDGRIMSVKRGTRVRLPDGRIITVQ